MASLYYRNGLGYGTNPECVVWGSWDELSSWVCPGQDRGVPGAGDLGQDDLEPEAETETEDQLAV